MKRTRQPDPEVNAQARDHFAPLFANLGNRFRAGRKRARVEAVTVATLAWTQLQVEEMREEGLPITRPEGMADAAALRGILAAAAACGFRPEEDRVEEFAALLIEGHGIRWPPAPKLAPVNGGTS